MTFEWCHRKLTTLSSELDKQFLEKLKKISPDASLCYQPHHSKCTVSLYNTKNTDIVGNKIDCSHVEILSSFEITSEIEQLAEDINKFIQRK